MFPEDGRLWIYGLGEGGVTAFTENGIENLRQIIVDERTAGPCAGIDQTRQIAPHLRCSPHGNVSYLIGAFSRAASLSTSSGGRSEVIQNCGGTGSRW